MSRIPQSFIDDLLARIDIVDVIEKHVPLKKTGSNYSARCPFHNEKSPSFSVSARKQFYYCFGCGANGNALGFLMNYDKQTFIEAIENLAQQVGMTVPMDNTRVATEDRRPLYDILQQACDFYQQQLRQHSAAQQVIDYLKNRGLTGKIAKFFELGFAPEGWNNLQQHLNAFTDNQLLEAGVLVRNDDGKCYDRFRNRLMFPIRDRQGRVIGFGGRVLDDSQPKYLNSPETPIFHKGSELYGLYEALRANNHLDQLIVVEGYMDVIALVQNDVTNAVATLGTATTRQNAERLFRQVNHVIFCFDGDNAGRTAAWRALENILPLLEDGYNVDFMFLPETEDPDSFIRKNGTDAFKAQIKKALPLSKFLLQHLSANVDLNALDGRARLIKEAESYVKQIPGIIFQQLLLTELAQQTQTSAEELRPLFGLTPLTRTKPINTNSKAKTDKAPTSLMQQALSIIVQYPNLVKNLANPTNYHGLDLPGADLLNRLLIQLAQSELSTGALLGHFSDPQEQQLLAKLAAREIIIPNDNLPTELTEILNRLIRLDTEQKLSNLQEKAASGQLSDTEKQAYLTLLSSHKNI
jgi:DNA primase